MAHSSHQLLGQIGFEKLKVSMHIGAFIEEQREPQVVFLSISATCDLYPASMSDQLRDALDYSALAQFSEEYLSSFKFSLLEKAVKELGFAILKKWPSIHSVTIELIKPQALPNATHSFCKLTLHQGHLSCG